MTIEVPCKRIPWMYHPLKVMLICACCWSPAQMARATGGGRALFSDPTPLRIFAALRPASAMIGDVVFDSARIGHAVAAACLARYNRVSARAIVSDDRCRPHR